MRVSREDAVKIAQDFVWNLLPTCPVRLDCPLAQREEAGGCFYWVIVFDKVLSANVVESPGEIIVLVDETSGKPEFQYVI